MVSNYLIFLFSYFLIVLSVVGHGLLAIKLTKTNVSIDEIGFVGLVGIFFLISTILAVLFIRIAMAPVESQSDIEAH